jgi:hypothetical protein
MRFTPAAVALCAALFVPTSALTAPTPIPGGANQVKGVQGKIGETLWNGKVRLKIDTVREETAAEAANAPVGFGLNPDQKFILIEGIVRNGTTETITFRPAYKLADKDDIIQSNGGPPTCCQTDTIAQGAAGKLVYRMPVPKDFVPVKLLVETGGLGPAFRITLSDTAAPAAAK